MSVKYEEDFLARKKYWTDIASTRRLLAKVSKAITKVRHSPEEAITTLLRIERRIQHDLLIILDEQITFEREELYSIENAIKTRTEVLERRKEK